jgi:hypothetical protein
VTRLTPGDEVREPLPPGRPRTRSAPGIQPFAHYRGSDTPRIRSTSSRNQPRCACGCNRKLRIDQHAAATKACADRIHALARKLLVAVQTDAELQGWRLGA